MSHQEERPCQEKSIVIFFIILRQCVVDAVAEASVLKVHDCTYRGEYTQNHYGNDHRSKNGIYYSNKKRCGEYADFKHNKLSCIVKQQSETDIFTV